MVGCRDDFPVPNVCMLPPRSALLVGRWWERVAYIHTYVCSVASGGKKLTTRSSTIEGGSKRTAKESCCRCAHDRASLLLAARRVFCFFFVLGIYTMALAVVFVFVCRVLCRVPRVSGLTWYIGYTHTIRGRVRGEGLLYGWMWLHAYDK